MARKKCTHIKILEAEIVQVREAGKSKREIDEH